MPPRFLYFDLGKVLVDFSVERMLRQVGEVAGVEPARVEEVVFEAGLQRDYEAGRISAEQFYETFCEQLGSRPDYRALRRAGSEIFELNVPILPLVTHVCQAGYRVGVLSNTCESHWEYCLGRFRFLSELFPVHALSFQIHAVKPEPAIFRAAAELADVEPAEIFFVDDTPGHVAGARAVGIDAVPFTSVGQLAADLRAREVRFNY